jgi:16S rRNA processing protein RimM
MDVSPENLIVVGYISGTHGIKGQVKLHSYSGNLASLQATQQVCLRSKSGVSFQVRLKRASDHSGKILLSLDGYDSITQAEDLIGCELLLQRDQLPAPDEDEYYWHDLLGLSVITNAGIKLGVVADILETGANDVYLVKDAENRREYLIPAIANVINSINLQSGTMFVTPLEGLLDL